jgi:quercetin 2,3-dioxygenase
MISIRRGEERGKTEISWLDSRHSFSFGHYYDPRHMGFSVLRVINDDRVRAGAGFAPHGHRDMEIISYVVDGALAHQDSTGSSAVTRSGEVQRMTAGRGIQHSEFNGSKDAPVRFLQIWIMPEKGGLEPGYEQKAFPLEERRGKLALLLAPDGAQGALKIHQDVRMYGSVLETGDQVDHAIEQGRSAWVQVVRGKLEVNGHMLAEGDGAAIEQESRLELRGIDAAEVLVFDLP